MGVTADRQGVIVSCPSCGKSNRMRFATLGKTIRCGSCRTILPALAVPVDIPDTSAFDAAARESALPLLVDFWAPWCGPCRMVAPELEKLAQSREGKLVVAKVDTEALPSVAAHFGIRSIPTMILFEGGREAKRLSGAMPANAIASQLAV